MDNQPFPRNAQEALAMLYVTKTIPVNATPEDYAKVYEDAITRINQETTNIHAAAEVADPSY